MTESANHSEVFTYRHIWQALRAHWRRIGLVMLVCGGISFVLTLFTPPYYRSDARFKWEEKSIQAAAAINQLGRAQGIGLNQVSTDNTDAMRPYMYKEWLKDNSFMKQLLANPVETSEGEHLDLFTYLQKYPQLTLEERIEALFERSWPDQLQKIEKVNPQSLTPYEEAIFERARNNIQLTYYGMTHLLQISVMDADRKVCIAVNDSLQSQITRLTHEYRYGKNADLLATQRKEELKAQKQYEEAVAAYSQFAESHAGQLSPSTETTLEQLEGNMQVAQVTYSAVRMERLQTERLLHENSALLNKLKPSTVAAKYEGPHTLRSAMLTALLAMMLMLLWYLRDVLLRVMRGRVSKK